MSEGEQQGAFSRRAADAQIPMLAAKVGHLEASFEQLDRGQRDLRTEISYVRLEVVDKLDHISLTMDSRTRTPMLPIVGLLAGGAGFLITVMGLLYNNQSNQLTNLQDGIRSLTQEAHAHMDGHPVWVTQVMDERFASVQATIQGLIIALREMGEEKEGDIQELRGENRHNEARNDAQESRLAVLETQMEERSEFFGRYIDIKADDRWTRSQDDERTRGQEIIAEQQHKSLERRIDDTRDLIRSEHWKLQIEPQLQSLQNSTNGPR